MPPPPGGLPNYSPPPGAYTAPGVRTTASGTPLASWGIRLGGLLIDSAIFFVVRLILGALFHRTHSLEAHFAMTNNGTTTQYTFSFLVLLISALLFVAYGAIMIGGNGQTIGMMAVGIRAVRDGDEGPVGFGKAAGRAVVATVLGWTVIIGLLSDLWPLWDQKRQTFQDKAVGTVVIRSRPPG
jgi:uncharacterized RDD family membrane protein YckC